MSDSQLQPAPSGPAKRPKGKEVLAAIRALLSEQPKLLLLPVLSGISAFIAMLLVWIPLGLGEVGIFNATDNQGARWVVTVIALWISLFVATAVAIYFQVAIVFGVNAIMDGQKPTLGWCLSQARSKLKQILAWSAVSATVGVILRLIGDAAESSSNGIVALLGILVRLVGGAAWAVASFFVVPIIVTTDMGPIEALKESVRIVRAVFGTLARSGARFGIWAILATIAVIALVIGGVYATATNSALGVSMIVIGLLLGGLLACVLSVFSAALNAVLYRYSKTHELPTQHTETFTNLTDWMVEKGQEKAAANAR